MLFIIGLSGIGSRSTLGIARFSHSIGGFFYTKYTMNNEDLKRVTTMKDLGVIFSSDLSSGLGIIF